MVTYKHKKASALILKEIADIIQKTYQNNGILISVTKVRITTDISFAKVYISIFPCERKDVIFKELCNKSNYYKKHLGKRLRYKFRNLPKLSFRIDDSLEYIDKIEKELRLNNTNSTVVCPQD